MYYLQTRYYDPELGRFISADSIEYLDPETIGGLNLYAYCNNNPVMGIDPEGTFLISLLIGIFAVAGAVAVGTITYNAAKDAGYSGWELAGLTILGAIGGGILGGLIGAGIGIGIELIAAGASMLGTGLGGMSLALANGMAIGTAGAMVVAGIGTMVVGGAIAVGSAVIGINVVLSENAKRFAPKDKRSNTSQNKEFERIADEFDLNKDQRRRLHDRITKKGYTRDKILEILKQLFPHLFD